MNGFPPLRVCYFGTYRAEYSRNRIMIEGLRRNGVVVYECHVPLWQSVEDRVAAVGGGWRRPAFWRRLLGVYARLICQYRRTPPHDVLVVGYPGQLDVFPARLLSWLRGRPLVWDIFMSTYLIAAERGLKRRSRLGVCLLRQLEWAACRLPDLLILDTEEYVAWFGKTHGVAPERFRLVPTGADDRFFQPAPPASQSSGKFRVVYYGTFIPNHGVEYIMAAARLLADEPDVHFELIGEGPERQRAAELARQYDLQKVTFIDWLAPADLARHTAGAQICLGVFGQTPQSLMTIQNKIYESLAMGVPVITGDSPAVRRMLRHEEHLYLVPRANPTALAEAICILKNDVGRRQALAAAGQRHYQNHFTPTALGALYYQHLQEMTG